MCDIKTAVALTNEANKSLKFGDRRHVNRRHFTTKRISACVQKCLDPRKGI